MVSISQEMIGLDAASAELDRLMTADAGTTANTQTNQSASDGQRAAQTAEAETGTETKKQATDSVSKDGKSASETQKADQQQQQKTETQQATSKEASEAGKTLSKFAKAKDRQDKSWAEINRQKEELRAEREQLARDRDTAKAERDELEKRRQAEETKFSPQQYEQAAAEFEKQGKFDLADAARKRAEELRKNPPPSPQQAAVLKQQQDQHAAAMKEWWGKAAVDFPKVAEKGSSENLALETFLKAEPEAVKSPKGMYYAARLIHAESAAARMPEMEKELGALRARVKELEGLTTPGGHDVPANSGRSTGQRIDAEELADLERMAVEMGTLR